MRSFLLGRTALAVGISVIATNVNAQEATAGDDRPVELAAADVVDDNMIIVTGQKIDRTLQETPISVAIFDEESIQKQNFTDIFDIIGQTANVADLFSGEGFAIRGIQNQGAGGSGETTSDVASIYIDGVFIPSNLLSNGPFSLWDVESVEIFRGPQSTIQGRNALAGAVIIRTNEPDDELGGQAQVELSEFNTYRGSAALNVPIVPGQLAVRASGDYLTSDGFVDNIVLDDDEIDESDAITARGSLLFTPDFAPDFSARLNYTYADQEEGENRVVESLLPAQRVSNQNVIDRQGADAHIVSGELTYDFTNEFSVTSVTGYIESDSFFRFDSDNGPGGPDEPVETTNSDRIITEELRLTYEGNGITALLGGYFFDQRSTLNVDNTTVVGTDFAFPDPTTIAGLLFGSTDPASVAQAAFIRSAIVAAVPEFPVTLQSDDLTDIQNFAVFGEATVDITDRFRVTVGARYDIENIDQTVFDATIVPPIVIGDPLLDPILAGVTTQFTSEVTLDADNEFDAFLPKVGLSYDVGEDVTLSAIYQRAYRAGGLSFNAFRAALAPEGSDQTDLEALEIVNSFDPEFTDNFELSLRSQWLDGALTVNANAFYILYDDQQVLVQLTANPLDTLTDNVGQSELRGFEVELTALPTDGLSTYFNVGYTDTEFTSAGLLVGGIDVEGNSFAQAPRWTLGAGGRYVHETGFYTNVRSRLTDESFSNVSNSISGVQDALVIVDLSIGWQNDFLNIEAFARNLFDADALTFDPINDPNPSGVGFVPNNLTTAIANDPQVFGVRAFGRF
ncbi:MAG: TonB-dependent receptor [Pseudomonadota bacterium]